MTRRCLSPDEVVGFLNRMSYKPGWKIRGVVEEADQFSTGIAIQVTAKVENSRPEGPSIVEVGIMREVPQFILAEGIEDLKKLVFQTLESLERHEAREWFAFDGLVVQSPHKEISPPRVRSTKVDAW